MESFWTDLLDGERYALVTVCIAYALLMGASCLIIGLRIRRWPHSIGTLTEEEVSTLGHYSGHWHVARVRYVYSVDGKPYSGKRLGLFIGTGKQWAERQLGAIQRHGGDKVTVFYNPARPQKSYLIVPSIASLAGVSTFMIAIAILLWFAI